MATTQPSPCLIVIFGASGDLTKRKLIPSLFELFAQGHLPDPFAVLGMGRTEMSDDAFRAHLKPWIAKKAQPLPEDRWNAFAQNIHYHTGDPTATEAFPPLKQRMAQLCAQHKLGASVLFYLSLAPQFYEPVINHIGYHQMITEGKAWCSVDRNQRSWQRIIIEKPFGHDPGSAAHLNRVLGRVCEEENIYRIDHYLGKDTVQNMMAFRFANAIFEPIWNRNYIDHIQVTAGETVGVESRGSYYDSSSGGAMRDMIQSHLLQVMAVVAMEPPVTMKADDIRVEQSKILQAVRLPVVNGDYSAIAVKGQYGPGQVDGVAVPGFRLEKGVRPDSQTDTYAALQVMVDTWRWGGVPFYLRSGKRLAQKLTEVVIYFKPTPHRLFLEQAMKKNDGLAPNQIVINIQPDEGIRLRFEGKVPGIGMTMKSVVMDFDYAKQFNAQPMEAYATLLLDAMKGDQTLYKHRDEIDAAWSIVQPVLDYWGNNPQEDLPNYASGTWGPSESDVMMGKAGRHWHNPVMAPKVVGRAQGM